MGGKGPVRLSCPDETLRLARTRPRFRPERGLMPAHSSGRGLQRTKARVGLLLFLARRSLLGSRLTFVLLVVAVAAGAGFQVPNTANLAGFSRALLEEGLTRGAGDVRVEPRERARFEDGDAEAARIRALVGARAAAPILVFPGAVGTRGRFQGAPIHGLDLDDELLPFHVTSGEMLERGDSSGVLLGSSLAKRLGVGAGDSIDLRVIFGSAETAIDDENIGRYTMVVRGVVAGSAGGYRFVFVDRGFLAQEAGQPRAASSIVVHLDDHFAASAVAERINESLPHVQALGWKEDDPYLANYLRANKVVNTVSYAMVIAAISVPVWALLFIHVLSRRREIGILSALGFGRHEIFFIFLFQSMVVACVGFIAGSGLGYFLIRYFQSHPIFEWEGLVVRPLLTVSNVLVPCLVILITTLVAGTYPAWRAARTDPARVLRSIE
jgi:lipoprotein-releasing system permease protein